METTVREERDLVLHPNEFAFVFDKTKGDDTVYVGPKQASLSQTDQLVIFDEDRKEFRPASLDDAKTKFMTAPEGWYITLKNPAASKDEPHPKKGAANHLVPLNVGRKINIQGPSSFALWPGQMARVVQGHNLRSNQYLIVRVYDEEAARDNWTKAVMKPQTDSSNEDMESTPITMGEVPDLTMGQLLVIKGTDVSFYIPPTGVEVVRDGGNYVRDAVTLETLEYCMLLNENGSKRFLRGPDVVFPEPTDVFVEKNDARKFRAIELNELQGIYIKVTSAYTADDGTERREGDELFITGNDEMLYFPRAEHAIIMRDGRRKHYAVAIPEGEARYVLDRMKGTVSLEKGPKMFLPDPRKHIIVRRVLIDRLVELLYPGNAEAKVHNAVLHSILAVSEGNTASDAMLRENMVSRVTSKGIRSAMPGVGVSNFSGGGVTATSMLYSNDSRSMLDADWQEPTGDAAAEEFHRRSTFTAPPTITIDSKYDGAVAINVWTGYAVLLVRKSGARRVIEGPQTVLLEYDETPEVLTMSTGKPKTTDDMFSTVYLRTRNNKISDIIKVTTKDLCDVRVKVSHRVNFTGDDPTRWFDAENYVKILCDHVRSIVRKIAKQYGVVEFNAKVEDIIRDTVLGLPTEGEGRAGRTFDENNMQIYDIEVLTTTIGDDRIASQLTKAQHDVVEKTLLLQAQKRAEEIDAQRSEINMRKQARESDVTQSQIDLQMQEQAKKAEQRVAALTAANEQLDLEKEAAEATVERDKITSDYDHAVEQEKQGLANEELLKTTEAIIERAKSVSPQLVAAIQSLGDKMTLADIAEKIAPLSYIGKGTLTDALMSVVGEWRGADVLKRDGNGHTTSKQHAKQRSSDPRSSSEY